MRHSGIWRRRKAKRKRRQLRRAIATLKGFLQAKPRTTPPLGDWWISGGGMK